MKFKKLTLLDFDKDFFDESHLSRLRSVADDLVFITEQNIEKRNEKIKDADALLIRYFTPINRMAIDFMPNLKYIGASSVAVDQVEIAYAKKKGIAVTNIAGYSSNPIAEFVFGALLGHIRKLSLALENVGKNDSITHPEYQGWELKGKTFGILGLGNIGKRVSEIALSFGMDVQYYSRNRKSEYESKGFIFVDFEQLLKTSDVLGVFLELNDETKGMITNKHIALIKKDAITISPSHTELFNFQALINALNNKNFTFIQTYFSTISREHCNELRKAQNTILYPSIAIQTVETKERQQEMIVSNLENFYKGTIQNEV